MQRAMQREHVVARLRENALRLVKAYQRALRLQ